MRRATIGVQVELGEPCATLYVSNLNEKIKPKGAATGRTVLRATLKMLCGVLYRACCMLHAVSLCACAELPLALYSVFHHFGPILDIQTRKTQALKGQVWFGSACCKPLSFRCGLTPTVNLCKELTRLYA